MNYKLLKNHLYSLFLIINLATNCYAQAPLEVEKSDFDIKSVLATSAALPPFPFFSLPEGVTKGDLPGKIINFDRRYFIAGDKIVAIEGKVYQVKFPLKQADREYSSLELHRNYENLIKELGGVQIDRSQYTRALVESYSGRKKIEEYYFGPAAIEDYEHHTYLIRSNGKEVWIQIATGSFPNNGYLLVLERQAMQQSVSIIKAAQIKSELDSKGRIALYINFDTDKATLRPDARPVIQEIVKLLEVDAALKVSIEGHTDSTGDSARNKELSEQRAATVVSELTANNIEKSRLSSKGFGASNPIADNSTEEGRFKNRRVELVKVISQS